MVVLKDTYEQPEIHEKWESVYRRGPLQGKFNDRLMDRIMEQLSLEPNALFLDAGCGTGDHSIRIARHGFRCVCVDLSDNVLAKARKNVFESGYASKVTFHCESLENLSFSDTSFDVVHCRGVLMHIPAWEKALYHLCRVLKPGGKIVVMECNHRSLDTLLALIVRKLTKRRSQMVRTPGGIEFWSERDNNPFLARIANVKSLIQTLKVHKIDSIQRFGAEFLDINRFPRGIVRDSVIRLNILCFGLQIPANLSVGNVVIGQKQSAKTARMA
jgi:ubiquinone/menaquinone biosynthesis C-methylase UbiE